MKKMTVPASNIVFCFLYLILIFCNYVSDTILTKLILFIIAYIFFAIYCYKKLKKIKYLLSSPGFIYGSVFLPYVVFALIMFIVDGYKSRIHFFVNNKITMLSTTTIYLYIYLILLILLTIFNCVKKYEVKDMVKTLEDKLKGIFTKVTFLDILTMIFAFLNLFKLLSYGLSFFDLSTLQKRAVLGGEFVHYINIYMMIYSLMVTLHFVKEKSNKKIMFFRILFIVMYWAVFLTCERRIFVAYLIGFIILFCSKFDKIKVKSVLAGLLVVVLLLLSASFRGNITFSNHDFKDVLYMSLTEFVCTYSISNYYVNNIDSLELMYGETYTKSAFLSLFPRAIAPNKPVELGAQFAEELNLNVAYSYNPVAEAILNFGYGAIVFLPLLILLLVLIANKLYKFNVLMPVILSAFSLDFYRGQFANYFFDSVMCFVVIFLIFNINYTGVRKKG